MLFVEVLLGHLALAGGIEGAKEEIWKIIKIKNGICLCPERKI